MKQLIVLLVMLIALSIPVLSATNSTEYSDSPFTDDSIYINAIVYTPVGSLTVTQDTVGSTLYFVSGTIEYHNYAWVHLFFGSDTTSAGVPQLVIGTVADTTAVTLHEYWWREDIGNSPMRLPFSFNQHMDTDSVAGAIKLYLYGKVQDTYHPIVLHDVRIEAITNLADQP